MRYESDSNVVYRNGLAPIITILIASVWVLGAVAAVIRDDEAADFLVFASVTFVPLWAFLILRMRVVLRASAVHIHGFFFHEVVRYDRIEDARFSGRWLGSRWLVIHKAGGNTVAVHPVLAAGLPHVDPFWQRPLAIELMERARQASFNTTDSGATQPDQPDDLPDTERDHPA